MIKYTSVVIGIMCGLMPGVYFSKCILKRHSNYVSDLDGLIIPLMNTLKNLLIHRRQICTHDFIDRIKYEAINGKISGIKECDYCTICHTTRIDGQNVKIADKYRGAYLDDHVIKLGN